MPRLYEEVAFIAYHFHWPPDAIVNLEHAERRTWVEQISSINGRRNNEDGENSHEHSFNTQR